MLEWNEGSLCWRENIGAGFKKSTQCVHKTTGERKKLQNKWLKNNKIINNSYWNSLWHRGQWSEMILTLDRCLAESRDRLSPLEGLVHSSPKLQKGSLPLWHKFDWHMALHISSPQLCPHHNSRSESLQTLPWEVWDVCGSDLSRISLPTSIPGFWLSSLIF